MKEIKNMLESLKLNVQEKNIENSVIFYLTNKLGFNIGKLLYRDNKISFNVYDPMQKEYSIEGGFCSVDKESIKEIIDEFTYFPYDFDLKQEGNFSVVSLGELIKDKSVRNLDYFTDLIFNETKYSEDVYFYEVPDEYLDDEDNERRYGILDAIRRTKENKPSATKIIMHSLS